MHQWYYDWTPDHRLSEDDECRLVWLCEPCAQALRAQNIVSFAGTDAFNDGPCWHCGAPIEEETDEITDESHPLPAAAPGQHRPPAP